MSRGCWREYTPNVFVDEQTRRRSPADAIFRARCYAGSMPIDTTKVQNRRVLRFESLEALAAEAQSLAECERMGSLVARGNWSLGQAINHVAVWIELAYADRVPVKVSWFQRLLAPFA